MVASTCVAQFGNGWKIWITLCFVAVLNALIPSKNCCAALSSLGFCTTLSVGFCLWMAANSVEMKKYVSDVKVLLYGYNSDFQLFL